MYDHCVPFPIHLAKRSWASQAVNQCSVFVGVTSAQGPLSTWLNSFINPEDRFIFQKLVTCELEPEARSSGRQADERGYFLSCRGVFEGAGGFIILESAAQNVICHL